MEFKIERNGNEWQIIADFGNPIFEVGEVVEAGFETKEAAEYALRTLAGE